MEFNLDDKRLKGDQTTWELIDYLRGNQQELSLESALFYYDFPILKDSDDQVIIAKMMILSPRHGIFVIAPIGSSGTTATTDLQEADGELTHAFSLIYSRLIRNKALRANRTELIFKTYTILYAPNVAHNHDFSEDELEALLVRNLNQLGQELKKLLIPEPKDRVFDELVATIEGAKGLMRPKPRTIEDHKPKSKGALANSIESEITSFDRHQKHGAMAVLDGIQRIRGLAGSGKTVVLAMKAALTHLRYPDSTICYTFYTKSLYQHIQRLITRFYRQFDDKDPDWTRLKIIHGWGGYRSEGVYFNACVANGIAPMSFDEAKNGNSSDPFGHACKSVLALQSLKPAYDYTFIDEGQDFPASFIQLCVAITERNRVVFAYDDLQTIFQAAAPSLDEILGDSRHTQIELTQDVVLHKCYRNPREILVCAHALGFGIYGDQVVQMLENREQWGDIGYKVVEGDLEPGSHTVIERPQENSLVTISQNQPPSEIVKAVTLPDFDSEIEYVVAGIKEDLNQGLRSDDILVIVVDDRHARSYLKALADKLVGAGIGVNNIHDDNYNIKDFYKDGSVTLSTVHKAKGNEAFMVYVVGVDALYRTRAGVRERNVLFTAMTRAKGWVRVSGIGQAANLCKQEISQALNNFPKLVFTYPSKQQLKIIRRDLEERDIRKQKAERDLEKVLDQMTDEEVMRFIKQRSIKKG